MVAIHGGVWSATLLVGLVLVLAAQSGLAMDSPDEEIVEFVEDGVVGDSTSSRGMDLSAVSDRPMDPFALWLLSMDPMSDHGSVNGAEDPTNTVDAEDPVDSVNAVAEDAQAIGKRAVDRTKARVQDGFNHEEPEAPDNDDDGPSQGSNHGGQGGGSGPWLQGPVCMVAEVVCDAPAPSQLAPDLPQGPPLPGLPMPGLPSPPEADAVDDGSAGDDEGPSWNPQGATVEGIDQDPGLGVALAAAAATAVVLVVAATTATTATGSMGSVAAWLARVLAGVKGFFLSLYARLKRDKVLDHGTRKELYLFLQANPGACITQIQGVLGTSLSTTRHHLDTLRSHGIVVDVKSGRRRCFFTREDGLSPKARAATAALTSKAARRVFREIERRPGIGQQDLADALRVSRTSVIFHVRRLRDAGLVRQDQEGRQVVYHPVEDASPSNGATDVAPSLFDARVESPTPDFSS